MEKMTDEMIMEAIKFFEDSGNSFADLRTKFPEIFTDEFFGNVPPKTVILGFTKPVYNEYLHNRQRTISKYLDSEGGDDKYKVVVIWGEIYSWSRQLPPRDRIGTTRIIYPHSINAKVPKLTFFSNKNKCIENELPSIPYADEYQYDGRSYNTLSRAYKSLEDFCRGEELITNDKH